MPETVLVELAIAARSVAKLLNDNLDNVLRTAMVFEGFGIDHAHAKLFPMHGAKSKKWKPIRSEQDIYFEEYKGYISSHNFKGVSAEDLARTAKKIRG